MEVVNDKIVLIYPNWNSFVKTEFVDKDTEDYKTGYINNKITNIIIEKLSLDL